MQFSDHQIGRGRVFYDHACGLKLEGIVSKRADAAYAPGNRGLWLKVECLNHEEFVVLSRICFPFSGPGIADNGIPSRGQ